MLYMSVYTILLYAEGILAVCVFFFLFKNTAPYGRYSHKRKHAFSYRMGWFIMELPAVFVIVLVYIASVSTFSQRASVSLYQKEIMLVQLLFLGVWETHYIYRTFIFPFLSKNKKNAFPLSVVFSGMIFNCINGFINGWALFFLPYVYVYEDTNFITVFSTVHFLIGIVLFFGGYVIHIYSDAVLRNTKKENKGEYGIPNKFLHKYVTAPNYFGEIIQWLGFAIMTLSPSGFVFAFFTIANLVPRAFAHRKWYIMKFPYYPSTRKVIIPFII